MSWCFRVSFWCGCCVAPLFNLLLCDVLCVCFAVLCMCCVFWCVMLFLFVVEVFCVFWLVIWYTKLCLIPLLHVFPIRVLWLPSIATFHSILTILHDSAFLYEDTFTVWYANGPHPQTNKTCNHTDNRTSNNNINYINDNNINVSRSNANNSTVPVIMTRLQTLPVKGYTWIYMHIYIHVHICIYTHICIYVYARMTL